MKPENTINKLRIPRDCTIIKSIFKNINPLKKYSEYNNKNKRYN
jgi:hypothetical protein